jgi:hypothetical protein
MSPHPFSFLAAAAAALVLTSTAGDNTPPRYRVLSSPSALDFTVALPTEKTLHVHAWTIPAYGHYQTLKGVALVLASRGHNVTIVGCDRTEADAKADGLMDDGPSKMNFLGLGLCAPWDVRDDALAKLIAEKAEGMKAVLGGMRDLAQNMCEAAEVHYSALSDSHALPDVIVFDADTYCAMDVSARWRVPRVARVGTGPRDAFTTPLWAPLYGSGASAAPTLGNRLMLAAAGALSRVIVAPLLLPWLYSHSRAEYIKRGGESEEQRGILRYAPSPAMDLTLNENAMIADLPWDGIPTLFNTHWGLEHARALRPFEHAIGHSNDFKKDSAKKRSVILESFLDAPGGAPVVYVGLGTLSSLPNEWINRLARALAKDKSRRFIWSVAPGQAATLPAIVKVSDAAARCTYETEDNVNKETACKRVPALSRLARVEAIAEEAVEAAIARGAPDSQPPLSAPSTTTPTGDDPLPPLPPTSPGTVLIVDWAPQLSVLLHPAVSAFVTHGGMNGIAEGTFARIPFVCLPLFSDQPDNCARVVDHGLGLMLRLAELEPLHLTAALDALLLENGLPKPLVARALQEAWIRNVGAGGAPRAADIIEMTAALGYDARLAEIPRIHFLPWWQKWQLDIICSLALFFCFVSLLLLTACRIRFHAFKRVKTD